MAQWKIDQRFLHRILDEYAPDQAVSAIANYLRPRDPQDPELGMTRPEMNFGLLMSYLGVVEGEGHYQYFRTSADRVERLIEAAEEMGLPGFSDNLRSACSVFPSDEVLKSPEARERFLESIDPAVWSEYDRMLDMLMSYPELDTKLLTYLRENREELLVPESE